MVQIVAVGPEVPAEFAIGKRVCVENHYYCGHCYQCTHGLLTYCASGYGKILLYTTFVDLRHICRNMEQFGHGKGTIYGGCSEYTIVPAKYAYILQSDIDDAKAAILEREH